MMKSLQFLGLTGVAIGLLAGFAFASKLQAQSRHDGYLNLKPEWSDVSGGMTVAPQVGGPPALKPSQWRLCSRGSHWVGEDTKPRKKGHHQRVQPGRCVQNGGVDDVLEAAEMKMIATRYFGSLPRQPVGSDLGFIKGSRVDEDIRGWTAYWNSTLTPRAPLDPAMVKALIATESGFQADVEGPEMADFGRAHGLLQVTDEALAALRGDGGEIKDHLVIVPEGDTSEPTVNIGVGIRWLFHKLDRERSLGKPTWRNAVAAYKSCSSSSLLMNRFDAYLGRLQQSSFPNVAML